MLCNRNYYYYLCNRTFCIIIIFYCINEINGVSFLNYFAIISIASNIPIVKEEIIIIIIIIIMCRYALSEWASEVFAPIWVSTNPAGEPSRVHVSVSFTQPSMTSQFDID